MARKRKPNWIDADPPRTVRGGSAAGLGIFPRTGPTIELQTTGANAELTSKLTKLGTQPALYEKLKRLASTGKAKMIAEPTMVTTIGRPARLLSGGEFPIVVPAGSGAVAIKWREFGTALDLISTEMRDGLLTTQFHAALSERDFSNSVTASGITVQGQTSLGKSNRQHQ